MNASKPLFAAFVLLIAGCAAKDSRSLNVTPPPPGMSGTYDFDLIGDITARECASKIFFIRTGPKFTASGSPVISASGEVAGGFDIMTFYGPLFRPLSSMFAGVDEQDSLDAATYTALSSTAGADVILVTKGKSDGFSVPVFFSRYCSEISGKAVKLKKAGAGN